MAKKKVKKKAKKSEREIYFDKLWDNDDFLLSEVLEKIVGSRCSAVNDLMEFYDEEEKLKNAD